MPLHAISRRDFLTRSAAVVAGVSVLRFSAAAESAESVRFALLSDTHIPSSPDVVARDVNMTSNLKQVIHEILRREQKPAGVLINGDCAYLKGLPEDYANFAQCVKPLLDARLPLHLTMGNHDSRENLYTALQSQRPEKPLLEGRHLSILETPVVNLFLLDTLTVTNVVTGEVGPEQMAWLAKELDARSGKPAVVIAHHTPQFKAPETGKPWSGIADTSEFMTLLASKKQVKAFVYGHSHVWSNRQEGGTHLINLPPVAYVFNPSLPNGWVDAEFRADGVKLQLHAIDPAHDAHLQTVELKWA